MTNNKDTITRIQMAEFAEGYIKPSPKEVKELSRRLLEVDAELQERRKAGSAEPVVPELKPGWMEDEFSAGWNACRAAMLRGNQAPVKQPASNEPVSQPYKLPDFREKEDSSTGSFRENKETSTKSESTQWPHRTVRLTFSHETVGDQLFYPMMLTAHQELVIAMSKSDPEEFTASNGVSIKCENLTRYEGE